MTKERMMRDVLSRRVLTCFAALLMPMARRQPRHRRQPFARYRAAQFATLVRHARAQPAAQRRFETLSPDRQR